MPNSLADSAAIVKSLPVPSVNEQRHTPARARAHAFSLHRLAAVSVVFAIVLSLGATAAMAAAPNSQPATPALSAFVVDPTHRPDTDNSRTPNFGIQQGAEGVLPIGVRYTGTTMVDGALTVTVTLPNGLTYARATSGLHALDDLLYQYACSAQGQVVTCTLRMGDNIGQLAVLPADQTMDLYLVVRAAKGLVPPITATSPPPTGSKGVSRLLGDVRVAATMPSAAGPLSAALTKSAFAMSRYSRPALRLFLDSARQVDGNQEIVIRGRNVGGLPVTANNGVHAVTMTQLLPKVTSDTTYSAGGKGWRCLPAARPTKCYTDQAIGLGEAMPDLTIRWDRLPAALARDGKHITWDIKGRGGWQTTTLQDGKVVRVHGTCPFGRPLRWRASTGAAPDLRVTSEFEQKKGSSITQGKQAAMTLKERNSGQYPAQSVALSIAPPTGLTVKSSAKGWSCSASDAGLACDLVTATLDAGATVNLPLQVTAARDAPDGTQVMTITPTAAGDAKGHIAKASLVVGDIGDPVIEPRLRFETKPGNWQPWTRGGPFRTQVGQRFSYRIELTNTGGDVLPAGTAILVEHQLGAALHVDSASSTLGACSTAGGLSCSLTSAAVVNPGASAGWIEVSATPTRATTQPLTSEVVVRVPSQKTTRRAGLKVRVAATPRSLRVSTDILAIPSVGGAGRIAMRVRNQGATTPVSGIVVRTTLPPGLAVESATGTGWECTVAGRALSCAFAGSIARGRTSTSTAIGLRVAPTAKSGLVALRWTVVGDAAAAARPSGSATTQLAVRRGILAKATATPAVVMPARNPKHPRFVVLDGGQSARNGVSLDYTWTQRCTTAQDVAAFGSCPSSTPAPVATVKEPHIHRTTAEIPTVAKRTVLVFQLTVTDRSATSTKTVRVTAVPRTTLDAKDSRSSGRSPEAAKRISDAKAAQRAAEQKRESATRAATTAAQAAQRQRISAGQATIRNALHIRIANGAARTATRGETVTIAAQTTGGTGDVRYVWARVSGVDTPVSGAETATLQATMPASRGVQVYRVTATDHSGIVASTIATISVDPDPTGAATCAVSRAKPKQKITLGQGATVVFGSIRGKSGCGGAAPRQSGGTQLTSFSNSTFTFGDVTVTGASGTTSTSSTTITSGTVNMPASWNLPATSVGSDGLTVTYLNGSNTALSGTIDVSAFPFLTLPSDWTGSSTVTFTPNTTTQSTSVSITATAASGDKSFTFTATAATAGTFSASIKADSLLSINGTTINVAGTVTNTTGTIAGTTSTITGSINSTLQLSPGVNLTELTANWDASTTGDGITGSATVAINSGSETPTALTATFTYSNANNWLVTLTSSGGPTWTPLPGLNVSPSDFSGSIGQAKGAWEWDLEASIASWQPTSIFSLTDTSLQLTSSCSNPNLTCPNADLFMIVGTTANLTPPVGDSIQVASAAVFGIGGGKGFSLYAGLPNAINVAPGISFTAPSLNASYALPSSAVTPTTGQPTFTSSTESGWSINTVGGMNISGLGSFTTIASNITSKGVSIGGFDPDGVSLGGSGGGGGGGSGGGSNGQQSNAAFGYTTLTSASMTATIEGFGSQTLGLTASNFSVAGGFASPTWFGQMTGVTLPSVLGTIVLDPTTGFYDATIDVPGSFTIPSGGSNVSVPTLNFGLSNNASGFTVFAGGTGALSVPSVGGGTSSAPSLSVDLSYDITTNTVTGTFAVLDSAGWQNAFGATGLTVTEADVAIGFNLDTETPTIALAASGTLPSSITQAFGVPSGVPISVGADLSLDTPCVEVAAGSTTGTQQILSVGGGAMTATYFEFVAAPDGCSLGTVNGQQVTISPGFAMAFDGTVLGTEVDVAASLTLSPTVFVGTANIGAFTTPGTSGNLQFQSTTIGVSINTGTNADSVTFAGGLSIFGDVIDLSGALSYNGGTQTTNASLTVASPQSLNINGFSLSNAEFTTTIQSSPTADDVSIAASGDLNIMGSSVDINAFDVTIDNGVAEDVTADVTANLNFGTTATVDGGFDVSWTASDSTFDLSASVVMTTAAGFTIGSQANPATLDISPQCVAFSGDISLSTVFTATLEGTMVYAAGCTEQVTNNQGQLVTGSAGDFSFAADNVGMTFYGLLATGSVAVGNVGGNEYETVSTAIVLSPQSANTTVGVAGSFDTNGDFSFTGTGTLNLAGFDFGAAITAAQTAGSMAVTGISTLTIGENTFTFDMEFSVQSGIPQTEAGATADLNLGGYDMGSTDVSLYQTPSFVGLYATVGFSSPLVSWSAGVAFGEVNNVPTYYFSADGSIGINGAGWMSIDMGMTNCTDSTCTATTSTSFGASGNLNFYGIWYSFPAIWFGTDGSFSASSSSSGSGCSSAQDVGGVLYQGCFSYSEYIGISSAANFTISSGQSVEIQSAAWNQFANPYQCNCVTGTTCQLAQDVGAPCCSTCYNGGWDSWDNWGWYNTGISVNLGTYPPQFSIYISGIGGFSI